MYLNSETSSQIRPIRLDFQMTRALLSELPTRLWDPDTELPPAFPSQDGVSESKTGRL